MSEAESGSDSPPAVFDRAGLLDRVMGDEELANEIVQDFLQDMPSHLEALEALIAAADTDGAERQAHFIKGAAATVGAGVIWELAFELERAGKAGDLAALRARAPLLAAELARLTDEVDG